ncbi:facilitated trehalose transporter Tret1-like [Rhopalosiphum maidis]|uniref:facilitated trehalose transporter Tret1-like n=1 Tax=Rhopalosiphum maidis TaxID=43146 RepID=UPI000EFE45F5|nr:facilitated trehalose transporter Tret1-like [Rhopalosiphum maidis]XP_026812037.1 facilitated trehalose transporter Tret1-like [Rhopalosiphum maidis]
MAELKSSKLDAENARNEYNLFKSSLAQIGTIIVQNVIMLGFGMSLAIPTVVIGSLMSDDGVVDDGGDTMTLTETEASWYGSVLLVCHPTGGLLSGVLQEIVGRKWCMALVSLPQLVGWYVLWRAGNAFDLYVSCVALGLSMGLSEAPVLTYVGETVEPRLRGPLSSVSTFTIMLGSFVAYLMSTVMPWRTVAMINMAVPVVSFAAVVLLTPESPVWLLSRNRPAEAKKSLAYLRGCASTADVEDEFSELSIYAGFNKSVDLEQYVDCGIDQRRLSYVKYLQINTNDTTNAEIDILANQSQTGFLDTLKSFWTPELNRPFFFIMLFFFFWSFATFIPAKPYLIAVFSEIGLPCTAQWTLVYTSILTLVGTLLNVLTVAKLGKRPITLVSMALCAFSMLGIGIYMVSTTYFSFSSTWIPMILLNALFFFSGYGVFPIPWMLVSEIYPTKGRGIASGLTAALAFLMTFILTKSFLEMQEWFTLPGLFIVYGSITLIGTLYLYACMPETENKTLQDIEHFFIGDLDDYEDCNNLS